MRLSRAAVACLAGASLAIFGATRVWSIEVTPRPGLSDLRAPASGADAQPWLLALALIALAGTGAMPATRGVVRRGLGVLIMLVGAGMALAAIAGRAGIDAGAAGAGATIWPIACVAGGALVVLAGLGAARHGHTWPVMGARYERRTVPRSADGLGGGAGPSPATGPGDGRAPAAGASDRDLDADAGAGDGRAPAAGASDRDPDADAGAGGGRLLAAGASDRDPDADARAGQVERPAPVDTRAAWDALDRGDDPTT